MALRKVRSNLDRLFDKSLSDLIRGIRNNKDNEARYIAACIEEIKMELRQDSTFVKANAVEKLAYLQMMGYDMSWASFNIIEVMASTKFTEKRIGYLAASQCFHDSTDVLMLATNMIRKDLHSGNMYDTGVALGALACFVTADLARDLACDIVNLLSSTRPYIRKRGVLLLYKMFLKYPECLKSTFPRLKEKLEDSDAGVQSAAVNVICELARKNPKNYLTLAPVFFKLMTTSSNNWMLIKIIKLFGALVPLEPRLGKKLLEPLTNLINSTSAMSLLYECINTVIAVLISVSSGVPGDHTASIQLCVQKLGVLIEDSDQNLKYLGLLAMGKILQYHPKAVQAHKDIMLRCLDDRDESIRLRALDLLYGMVSKKNIMEIVRKLMDHVDAAEGSYYRDELLSRIISICSYNNFQHITNFEWYISVLVELTKVEGTKHGSAIAQQMQDVAVRVQSIRHFAVSQMALLLENAPLLLAGSEQHRSNIAEVLLAAAWICGEYAEHVCNPQSVLESMLRTKISIMPGHVLSAYVQNIAKLYSLLLLKAEAEQDWDVIESLDNLMLSKLPQFELCDHLEAQERACTLLAILRLLEQYHAKHEIIGEDFAKLFEGELNPVAPKAQRKVPIPEGLDLDKWIHDPPPSDELEEAVEMDEDLFGRKGLRSEFARFGYLPKYSSEEDERSDEKQDAEAIKDAELSEEEMEKRRERRRAELENNPYYVKGDSKTSTKRPTRFAALSSVEKSEGAITELQSPLGIPGVVGLERYMEQQQSTLSWRAAKKDKKMKKGKKGKLSKAAISSSDDDEVPIIHQVNRADGEMPENAKTTDEEESENEDEMDAVAKALDFDIEESLREEKERRKMMGQSRRSVSSVVKNETTPESVVKDNSYNVPYDTISPCSQVEEKKKLKTKKNKEHKKKKLKKKRADQKEQCANQGTNKNIALQPQQFVDISLLNAVGSTSENDVLNLIAEKTDGKCSSKEKPEMEKEVKKRNKKTKAVEVAENHKVGSCSDKAFIKSSSAHVELSNGVKLRNTGENNDGIVRCSEKKADDKKMDTELPIKKPARLSAYRKLAANDRLKLTYTVRLSDTENRIVDVGIVFCNKSEGFLRQLEINILDTLNAKLIRESSSMGGIILDFQLPPGISAENTFKFNIDATNVSQRLRGTLTYFVNENDSATEEKLDFHLHLPSTLFVVAATIGSDAFEVLLSSGNLIKKSSVHFDTTLSWTDLLQRICFYGHFSVVEENDNCASLYGQQVVQMDPICLLVKRNALGVQIDGRSNDEQLLFSLLNDLKNLLSG